MSVVSGQLVSVVISALKSLAKITTSTRKNPESEKS